MITSISPHDIWWLAAYFIIKVNLHQSTWYTGRELPAGPRIYGESLCFHIIQVHYIVRFKKM